MGQDNFHNHSTGEEGALINELLRTYTEKQEITVLASVSMFL